MSASRKSSSSRSKSNSNTSLVETLRKEYQTADELIKEVQSYRREAGIPAINEMRYMGHHLLLSLDASASATDEDELRKAISHCQRAAYEAAEAGVLAVLDEVLIFEEDYKREVVTDIVPDYIGILRRAEKSQIELKIARQAGPDRDGDYSRIMKAFRALKDDCLTLKLSRPELNKKMNNERRVSRRWIFGTIIAVTALVVSVLAYLSQ